MLRLKGNENRSKISEFKLSTLLEITNAINNNLSEDELFVLFQYILQHQLNIGKAVVYVNQEGEWRSMLHYGLTETEHQINVERDLKDIKDITVLEMAGFSRSKSFDIVIPVFHQSKIIAFLLLGDIDEEERKASPIIKHLPFIQTLGNITAVAVENKRLVRVSLRQERMKRELEMASEMQALLLPSVLPNDKHMQMAALYKPHQEVGGDFYDVIKTADDEVVICMADVSGKGISAGIMMANFQASLRAHVQVGRNLEDILQELNRQVWKSAHGERFITLFMAKYNSTTRKLHYVNAAHPSPLLIHKNEVNFLTQGTVGLGMFDELPFIHPGKVILQPDTLFVCYTDGLNELENEKAEVFDENKLAEHILATKFSSMGELNKTIMDALNNHRGKLDFEDDIALVSCRFV